MNIAGVLVRARPERFPEVMSALVGMAGVEVHTTERNTGRIVVTLDDGDGCSVEEALLRLHQVDGVSNAALVYQYSDDGSDETQILKEDQS